MILKAGLKRAKQLRQTMKKMEDDARREMQKAIKKVAVAIQRDAVMRIRNPPKTGTQYGKLRDIKRVNYNLKGAAAAAKRIHQASAPGESPAWDTGKLAGSITVTTDPERVAATVTVGADYGLSLEFGTRNMGERPFLRPAIEANKHLLPAGIKDAFKASKPKKG